VNDYFGGQSPQELEDLLRKLVSQGVEGPKVDFKRTLVLDEKDARAELAKDISSIANTDDDAHLGDFGYIILGAEQGSLVGGVDVLAGSTDKLQARITDLLKELVGPLPQFSLVSFEDATLGWWGAIVIPPSARQPHLFVRNGASDVVKHEWWVRVNDTKERASPFDYGRIFAKATRREVRPLELEVQRLSALTLRLEHDGPTHASAQNVTASAAGPSDLVGSVRNLLVRGSMAVEEALVAESLRVAEAMGETSDSNPWTFSGMRPEQLRMVLSHLESRTFHLAEAMATIARYDQEGVLVDAVCRAVQVMAREPQPVGVHFTYAAQFRLYPLVLCLYAMVIVGANERRTILLKRLFGLSFQEERRDGIEPIAVSLRHIRAASDVFSTALERDHPEPIAVRIREILVPRLSGLLGGTPSQDAFFVAEFVLGLAFLKVSDRPSGKNRFPLPGTYMYESGARRTLKVFLSQQPDWLGEVFGEVLDDLLPAFDHGSTQLRSSSWASGFTSGATGAYRSREKKA